MAFTYVLLTPLVFPLFAVTVRVTFAFAPGANVTGVVVTVDGVVKSALLLSTAARLNVVLRQFTASLLVIVMVYSAIPPFVPMVLDVGAEKVNVGAAVVQTLSAVVTVFDRPFACEASVAVTYVFVVPVVFPETACTGNDAVVLAPDARVTGERLEVTVKSVLLEFVTGRLKVVLGHPVSLLVMLTV